MSHAEKQVPAKAEVAIKESNQELLDLVKDAKPTDKKPKKQYPPNQVSPLLEQFETQLIKERESA